MDQIEARQGTRQWQANEYNLQFERVITKVEDKKIFIDNPIVMAMEPKYGIGEIYKYSFDGRLYNVGIENLYCESEYITDTSENHSWDAVSLVQVSMAAWIATVSSVLPSPLAPKS